MSVSSTSSPDPNAKVMIPSPHGPICIPTKDLDKIKQPSFIGSTEFTKDTYRKHRAAFRKSFPYEKTIGMTNPYTGEKIHTESDYELYCLSFYLKCAAEEELSELRHSNDTLSRKVSQLQTELTTLNEKLSKSKRMVKTVSICLALLVVVLSFCILSQLFSSVIDPVFWLYFFIVLFFPAVFLIVLIRYRKKSIANKHTSVIIALILFIATMVFSFFRHFFL